MKKNMGTVDRAIRVLATLVIATLILTGQLEGTVATVIGVLAVVFLLTSLIGFCPLYFPFKISTRKESSTKSR